MTTLLLFILACEASQNQSWMSNRPAEFKDMPLFQRDFSFSPHYEVNKSRIKQAVHEFELSVCSPDGQSNFCSRQLISRLNRLMANLLRSQDAFNRMGSRTLVSTCNCALLDKLSVKLREWEDAAYAESELDERVSFIDMDEGELDLLASYTEDLVDAESGLLKVGEELVSLDPDELLEPHCPKTGEAWLQGLKATKRHENNMILLKEAVLSIETIATSITSTKLNFIPASFYEAMRNFWMIEAQLFDSWIHLRESFPQLL